jgi:predicted nucleic acid-binding protein
MESRVFLDTNILVYAINVDSASHLSAAGLIKEISAGTLKTCISPQVLCEFYATVTNPRKFQHPLSPPEATEIITGYLESNIALLYLKNNTIKLTLEMAVRYQISGPEIFDAQIVATMLENGVAMIYTANLSDFKKYSEITAVNPLI